MLYLLLFVLLVGGAFALFAGRALRSEHLLALRCRKGEIFLLAREADGRYALLKPTRVPAVVVELAWRELTGTLDTVPRRVARKLPARRTRAAHA